MTNPIPSRAEQFRLDMEADSAETDPTRRETLRLERERREEKRATEAVDYRLTNFEATFGDDDYRFLGVTLDHSDDFTLSVNNHTEYLSGVDLTPADAESLYQFLKVRLGH